MERKSLMMKSIKVNINPNVGDRSCSSVSEEEIKKWETRRLYSCSFCKREFKSAQALGGHMNVHRKERARQLTIISPPSNQQHHHFDINVQPSPEYSWIRPRSPSSSPSKRFSPFASVLPPLVSPSLSSISPPSSTEIKKCVTNFKKDDTNYLVLDLEDIGSHGDSKEHLDLELRLGYSN